MDRVWFGEGCNGVASQRHYGIAINEGAVLLCGIDGYREPVYVAPEAPEDACEGCS